MPPSPLHAVRLARAAVLLASLAATGARAQSQATQERCAKYAKRAVDQYKLAQAKPECQKSPDLRWQDNFDGHYQGCLIVPEFMANNEQNLRDAWLRGCGSPLQLPSSDGTAASDDGSGSGNGATGGGAGSGDGAGSAPTGAGSGTVAAAQPSQGKSPVPPPAQAPKVNLSDKCRGGAGAPSFISRGAIMGTGAQVVGGTLHYTDAQTHKPMVFAIVRPRFVKTQIECTGKPSDSSGLWMSAPGSGQSKIFNLYGPGNVVVSDTTLDTIQMLAK